MYTVTNWSNRDPMGERGGLNLYGFGPNSPINGWDDLGHSWTNASGAAAGFGVSPGSHYIDRYGNGSGYPPEFLKKFSLPSFNPNFKKSFSVAGCSPTGVPGVVVCLTGTISVKVGKCCNSDGSEGQMAEASGSITAGPGLGTGGWKVSDDIADVTFDFGRPACPTTNTPVVQGTINFSGSVSAGAISASSGCSYTFPGGGWSCSGGVTAGGGSGGANASVQGGIQVSGQFLQQ